METAILHGGWDDLTYKQIAESSRYSISCVRQHVGAKFWKLLSQALGEPVSKTNFRSALERRAQPVSERQAAPKLSLLPSSHVDWGEAPDVSQFYGRTVEQHTLTQWIVSDGCRLIALLGMGGMGKSFLAAKMAHQLQNQFEWVIWRSLRNAPPLDTLLADLISAVSHQQDTQAKSERLLHWLRTQRCLVILDNVETIMQAGNHAGHYQPDYEKYGSLLKVIGEAAHQSCVLLTSREKPAEVAIMEDRQEDCQLVAGHKRPTDCSAG